MIADRTIICIASRWDYDPTSKHHVMRALSRSNRILWVNYRGSRKPKASARDAGAVLSTLRAVARGPRMVAPNILEFTPLVIPGASGSVMRSLNRALLVGRIRRALKNWRRGPVQLWSFAPDVAFLAGRFSEEKVVYYCVDEFAAFEDHDAAAIRAAERDLMDKSDVVVTTAHSLHESRKDRHPNVHLVRHGVDVTHFSAAAGRTLPVPADIAALPRPIYGFFGLVHHWFDVELMAKVAKARPHASFVLLGEVHTDVTPLRALPNVHLLSRRPYAELPAYCSSFDAGLLPFRVNEMTRNINPIKLREYLAAGLPVVSTPLPEAAAYRPDVILAETAERFVDACDKAAKMSAPPDRMARSLTVSNESWDAVVERLSSIVAGRRPDEPCRDGGGSRNNTANKAPAALAPAV